MKYKWFVALVAVGLLFGSFTIAQAQKPNPRCGDRSIPSQPKHPVKVIVKADCRVFGDVEVGPAGRKGYWIHPDSDPNSGMIVDCLSTCKVLFRYGGGITGQLVDSIGRDMRSLDQCQRGCKRVDLRFFPITGGGSS